MGKRVAEAFEKAVFPGRKNPFPLSDEKKSTVLCSVTEEQLEESLPIARQLAERGFTIAATPGTARYYEAAGVACRTVRKSTDDVQTVLSGGSVAALFNLPTAGRNRRSFGFQMRALALRYQIPVYTCIDTLVAALHAADDEPAFTVHTLDEYRACACPAIKGN
jgi:carbamoyl-phosphate synthase large subunit